jgi:VanZ family protein
VKKTVAILFFLFICVVIYLADYHRDNAIFYYPDRFPFGDKIAHFLLFGILALLTNAALGFRYPGSGKGETSGGIARYGQLGSVGVLAFALIEELSQYYLPTRTLDSGDAAADILGVGLFTLISVAIMTRQQRTTVEQKPV